MITKNKIMNKDEKRAEEYLVSLGYKNIEYEKIKNKTPDFLIDDKIAVEVRRLNINFATGNIENFESQIRNNIKKIISNFKCETFNNSVYLSIELTEPKKIDDKKIITQKIKKVFKEHFNFITEEKEYYISDYLSLSFTPTEKKDTLYKYGDIEPPFGWRNYDLDTNIQYCIDEKITKINNHKDFNFSHCKEWWLILVDYVAYGMDNEDFRLLNIDKKNFSKIIILSHGKNSTVYEL